MDNRSLELTLISARNLKSVKHLSKMDVFVVIKITGDPNCTEQKSPVNRDGGCNPMWNYTMRFNISRSAAQMNRSFIQFILKCDRTVRGEKDIGVVYVPIKEIMDRAGNGNSTVHVKRSVKTDMGDKGELCFSYRFLEMDNAANTNMGIPQAASRTTVYVETSSAPAPAGYPPTEAAPAYAPPAGYPFLGYPTPPAAGPAGHAYPPAGGYAGYGCPPVVLQPQEGKKRSKLKVGAALVGGIVGGILLGGIANNAAAAASSQDATDYDACNNGDEQEAADYSTAGYDNAGCY